MFYGATPEIFENAKKLRNHPTETEEFLWQFLSGSKLNVKFRRQHPIDKYIADFYCHEHKLVIEIDGSVHDALFQKQKDAERDAEMNCLGLRVLRFSNKEVILETERVLLTIQKNLFPL